MSLTITFLRQTMYQGPHLCNSRGQLEVSICFLVFFDYSCPCRLFRCLARRAASGVLWQQIKQYHWKLCKYFKNVGWCGHSQDRTCYCSSGDSSRFIYLPTLGNDQNAKIFFNSCASKPIQKLLLGTSWLNLVPALMCYL